MSLEPAAATSLPLSRNPAAHPVRRLVMVVAACALITAFGLLTAGAIVSATGPQGLVAGTILAAVPVFPVVAAFLWLDRNEAEPAHLLAFAFGWGAAVASFLALVVNTASVLALQQAGGSPTAAAVLVAPVVEETLKGSAVLLILLVQRREFDGVVDGIVYAGMAGIGFAFAENVLYLGRAVADGGGTLAVTFVLRCVFSPFAHPLFTMATGVGLGIAARSRSLPVRVIAPLVGWTVAVLLHGAWNLSASSGLSGFVGTYVLFQLPIFFAAVGLAFAARRREARMISRHLGVYAETGWLTPAEVRMLGSQSGRRVARRWAMGAAGPHAVRAMTEFQQLASELAFVRDRALRGTAPPDAADRELTLLRAMTAARRYFLP